MVRNLTHLRVDRTCQTLLMTEFILQLAIPSKEKARFNGQCELLEPQNRTCQQQEDRNSCKLLSTY